MHVNHESPPPPYISKVNKTSQKRKVGNCKISPDNATKFVTLADPPLPMIYMAVVATAATFH